MDVPAEVWRTGWLTDRPGQTLSGAGLILERVDQMHLEGLVAAVQASLPELHAFMPWATMDYGREDAQFFIEDSMAAWEEGRAFTYVVRTREHPGQIAGTNGLMNRLRFGTLEIGYWVATAQTGRGVARRSTALLLDVSGGLDGVHTVEIHHDEANAASRTIPERLGFVQVGTKSVKASAPGKTGRLVLWSLDLPHRPPGDGP